MNLKNMPGSIFDDNLAQGSQKKLLTFEDVDQDDYQDSTRVN